MTDRSRPARDPFTFSLGGTTALNMVVVPPAIAAGEINRRIAQRLARPPEEQPDTAAEFRSLKRRFWPFGRRRAA